MLPTRWQRVESSVLIQPLGETSTEVATVQRTGRSHTLYLLRKYRNTGVVRRYRIVMTREQVKGKFGKTLALELPHQDETGRWVALFLEEAHTRHRTDQI